MKKGSTINADMAGELSKPYTMVEMKNVIFAINDNKSPGPDGFGSKFYKQSWETVGNEA